MYRTIPRKPLYEGGPDVTSPLAADFSDGLLAHLRDAIEQRPLVTFSPEGVGQTAREAAEMAPVMEAYFEREINAMGARSIITKDMAHEAVVVGTGIAKLSVTTLAGETFVGPTRTIRLENFFVDRIAVNDLQDTFCAYRYKERFYNLEDQAADGLLDPVAVEKINHRASSDEEQIAEEEELKFDETTAFAEENALHTLYCGYMRYRGTLYECIWHDHSGTILALRENPAREAFDAPPLALTRIGRQPGMLFGRGVPRRLESEQKVADNAINTHLAVNNLAAAPPVQYNVNNPIAKKLADSRVLEPGMWLPNYGPPDKQDIHAIQIPNSGLAAQDYDMALGMAQRRTYTDQAIGNSSSTRKTLGQFRTEVNKGTLKLHLDLGDFSYDMSTDLLKKVWAMMVAYKIEPSGIVTVEPMGKLLAAKNIPKEEVAASIAEAVLPALGTGQLTLEDLPEMEAQFTRMLTGNGEDARVPSVKRRDLTISLTGTKIIADKMSEFDVEMRLLPTMMNLLEGARADTYFNYWGRSLMRKAGLKDIEKRWPQDPGTVIQDPTLRFMLMQNLNELLSKSVVQ